MAEDSKCFACGKAGANRSCSKGCGIAIYCNKKCQNAHFRIHKVECQKACSRQALALDCVIDVGKQLSRAPDTVNVLEQKIFSVWERSVWWYNQEIVLHCHPSHSDFRSYQQLARFIGVYSPVSGSPMNMPFPIYVKDKALTDSMFAVYQGFSKNEKEYRSNQGDWLNEMEHFENPISCGSLTYLIMNCHFSIQADSVREGVMLQRTKGTPPQAVPMLSKAHSRHEDVLSQYHSALKNMYDEWKLSDNGSEVLAKFKMALTPLDIFLKRKTIPTEDASEYLLSCAKLVLKKSEMLDDIQGKKSAPEAWLEALEGVYYRTKGYVQGRYIGWTREESLKGPLLPPSRKVSNSNLDLCLYFQEEYNHFVVRRFNLLDGEVVLYENRKPELQSTILPSRKCFDALDPLSSITSNWNGYPYGEDYFSIPFELASPDYFAKRQRKQKYRTVNGERDAPIVPRNDLNNPGTGILEGQVEKHSGPVQKRRKRKKRKKKKPVQVQAQAQGDGTTPDVSMEQPSAETIGGRNVPHPTLDVKARNETPLEANEVIGNKSADFTDKAKENVDVDQSSHGGTRMDAVSDGRVTDTEDETRGSETTEKAQHKESLMDLAPTAERLCEWLREELRRCPDELNKCDLGDLVGFEQKPSVATISHFLFQTKPNDSKGSFWLQVPETTTGVIFRDLLSSKHAEALKAAGWIRANAKDLLLQCLENDRLKDIVALTTCDEAADWFEGKADSLLPRFLHQNRLGDIIDLMGNRKAVPFIGTNFLCQIFGTLPERKDGSELGNAFARAIRNNIQLDSTEDKEIIEQCMANKLDINASKRVKNALKKGVKHLKKQLKKRDQVKETDASYAMIAEEIEPIKAVIAAVSVSEDEEKSAEESIKHFQERIDHAIVSYCEQLTNLKIGDTDGIQNHENETDTADTSAETQDQPLSVGASVPMPRALSSKEIAAAMAKCAALDDEEKAEMVLNDVEMSLDLSNWNATSEWVVEITEQAHKFFRKRSKKQHGLCERVIRRMQLLSTGRWPYVLCKPVRTSKTTSTNLYESKIDSGSRILWEVAVSFSPRRSNEGKYFSEQVIRVWDIVVAHDGLTKAIDQAVERIEKSHIRGRDCRLFSELDGKVESESTKETQRSGCIEQRIPKVFRMKQGVEGEEVEVGKTVYYAPANDDEKQFNLLKFYEMNAEAVGLLLDGNAENADLPFTPGPQEHEIIHFNPKPKRSLLLQGRSGTGKTTCLVFRMWAEYMSLAGGNDDKLSLRQPRQLFLTKNDVLRREVEKSFKCMGLAWRKRATSTNEVPPTRPSDDDNDIRTTFPLFLTSSEWLDILDVELPGERFFSTKEVETRIGARLKDDAAQRGLEEFFDSTNRDNSGERDYTGARKEMTFGKFRSLWSKINSKTKSKMAPDQVWLEIKSHIKGSVAALHLSDADRSSQYGFLSRDEYLSLPRKQCRIDKHRRQEVYDLYERYEKLTKGKYYDEMDIVLNIAHRIPPIRELLQLPTCPVPVDAIYVDEVQDFTQSELLLLTKLCIDSNSLMLAGDTAQSINAGVWFRFTDVRQLFYGQFRCVEPRLQKLTHNYRSHSGILYLAAAVVELLYYFFADSLDRLPPDFGLFPGPKPVAMVVSSVEDLVLMLDGSKRETSRIEFGAHQVVLVRNEEAKQRLPEEFRIDKDWVMTVQESKGLEFDDVLLLNFFQDSPAGESWRVISNYGIEAAKRYYDECKTGSQPFLWDDIDTKQQTRQLDFDLEQHKTLETELKILYTAITRARVNVFIAEMDTALCQPMFNYFRRRQLVEFVNSDGPHGLSSLPVFGQIDTDPDSWKARGQYYLDSAGGESENIAALRLAARCFEKAGETAKMERALAYVAFLRIENQETEGPKTKKRRMEKKLERYRIAFKLLETGDTEFLVKAGLCLVRTGNSEFVRAARMLETYSSILYARRQLSDYILSKPNTDERRYYSYASKLYFRCMSDRGRSVDERSQLVLDCFRCCISSWEEEDLERALSLLHDNSRHTSNVILDLASIWSGTGREYPSPVVYWISERGEQNEASIRLEESMSKISRIACRQCHTQNDRDGLFKALSGISSRKERIELLSSLDSNAASFLRKCKWGLNHPAFALGADIENHKEQVDVTDLLLEELLDGDELDGASKMLAERGLLLKAADCLDRKSDVGSNRLSASLKLLYVELVQACEKIVDDEKKQLIMIIEKVLESDGNVLSADTRLAMLVARARHTNGIDEFLQLIEATEGAFILRKFDVWFCLLKCAANPTVERILNSCIGADSILKIGNEVKDLISQLGFSTTADRSAIVKAHPFFRLEVSPLDPDLLVTKVVTNWRFRTAMKVTGINFSPSSLGSTALEMAIDREETNSMLALYCCHHASELLNHVQEHMRSTVKKNVSGARSVAELSSILQCRIYCFEEMKDIANRGLVLDKKNSSLWSAKVKDAQKKSELAVSDFWDFVNDHFEIPLHFTEDAKGVCNKSSICITGKTILDCLRNFVLASWYDLSIKQKKTSFEEVLKLWKALDICMQNRDRAVELFGKKLKSAENLRHAQQDYEKHNMTHFIKSQTKVVRKKVKTVKSIFRMWQWALESATRNLFNSITLVERLLKLTSEKESLHTLPKKYQISLMENNCVALLAMISFRYSEAGPHKLWLTLPEKQYIEMYLTGNAIGRVFGIPMLDAVKSIEKTELAFTFFDRFLGHLETLADTSSGFLSLQEEEDTQCITRCIMLAFCTSCNAILLAQAGKTMGKCDIEHDMNSLPRIPLSGSILRLSLRLRETIFTLHRSSSHSSFARLSVEINEKSTALELFKSIYGIIEESTRDHLVVFRIERDAEGGCCVKRKKETTGFDLISNAIQSFEGNDSSKMNVQEQTDPFLALLVNDPYPTQELLSERNRPQKTGVADEVLIAISHGKRQEAARRIQRLVRNRCYKTALNNSNPNPNPVNYFLKWKRAMITMQQQLRLFLARKKDLAANMESIPEHSGGLTTVIKLPLASIPNRWADMKFVQEQQMKWQSSLFSRSPFFFDDAECVYCRLTLLPEIAAKRRTWCHEYLPQIIYRNASQKYNQQVFDEPILFSRGVGVRHSKLPSHEDNQNFVHDTLNKLFPICARVSMGGKMLQLAINACEDEARKRGPFVSWYLFRREEFLNLHSRMMEMLEDMQSLCSEGDIRKIFNSMEEFKKESLTPQSFLAEKRNEEEQMMSQLEDDDSGSIGNDVKDDVEEEDSDDENFDFEMFVGRKGSRNRK